MENKPRTRPLLLQLRCLNFDKFLYRKFRTFRNEMLECYDNANIVRPDKEVIIFEYVKHIFIATFIWAWIGIFVLIYKAHVSEKRKYPYRNNPQYKKVIKEGILFDTVEYHER